jgi:hypothetical protein
MPSSELLQLKHEKISNLFAQDHAGRLVRLRTREQIPRLQLALRAAEGHSR